MKKSNFNMFERLNHICNLLNKGNYHNADSLSDKCNVSIKTIYRDIQSLKDDYNAPVDYDNYRKGFYFSKPFKLSKFDLSTEDLYQVAVIHVLIKS